MMYIFPTFSSLGSFCHSPFIRSKAPLGTPALTSPRPRPRQLLSRSPTRMHTLLKATAPSNRPGPASTTHLINRGAGTKIKYSSVSFPILILKLTNAHRPKKTDEILHSYSRMVVNYQAIRLVKKANNNNYKQRFFLKDFD